MSAVQTRETHDLIDYLQRSPYTDCSLGRIRTSLHVNVVELYFAEIEGYLHRCIWKSASMEKLISETLLNPHWKITRKNSRRFFATRDLYFSKRCRFGIFFFGNKPSSIPFFFFSSSARRHTWYQRRTVLIFFLLLLTINRNGYTRIIRKKKNRRDRRSTVTRSLMHTLTCWIEGKKKERSLYTQHL